MTSRKFMKHAIERAKEGIRKGQTPFGACIVKNSKILSSAYNLVWKSTDITAHAEINAIRMACKKLKSINLEGCTIYCTTEPCPMCFSACHWARIPKIVYGTSINDAKKVGFNELSISSSKMKSLGHNNVKITGSYLREECLELFKIWSHKKNKRPY